MNYTLRAMTGGDFAFFRELQLVTIQNYVTRTFGWDPGGFDRRLQEKFAAGEFRIIVVDGQDAGALEVGRGETEIFLKNIQILPAFQNQGLGSAVIRDLLAEARDKGQPVVLQVLKVNPARQLYERLGFVVTEETPEHFRMAARIP